jgi:4'-phosphopantetheinyl transferase
MLEPSEILVWLMEVDAPSPATVASWRSCLDAAERAQADRFYFNQDRFTYAAAHWLVRNALAAAGGLPPACWRFVREKHGKPQVDPALGQPELRFNLSHSRELVACAVGIGVTIGIDVETVSPKHAALDIAERYFSSAEVAILRATSPSRQFETFFRFWTLKEALIKATGEGLYRPLDSFSFSLDPAVVTFHPHDPDEAAKWTFLERQPTPNHALALAIRGPSVRPLSLSISRVSIGDGQRTVINQM